MQLSSLNGFSRFTPTETNQPPEQLGQFRFLRKKARQLKREGINLERVSRRSQKRGSQDPKLYTQAQWNRKLSRQAKQLDQQKDRYLSKEDRARRRHSRRKITMSPEEQQELRSRFQQMSPEERRQYKKRMRYSTRRTADIHGREEQALRDQLEDAEVLEGVKMRPEVKEDLLDYINDCKCEGCAPSLNGWLNGKTKKQRKADREKRRTDRQTARQTRRDTRKADKTGRKTDRERKRKEKFERSGRARRRERKETRLQEKTERREGRQQLRRERQEARAIRREGRGEKFGEFGEKLLDVGKGLLKKPGVEDFMEERGLSDVYDTFIPDEEIMTRAGEEEIEDSQESFFSKNKIPILIGGAVVGFLIYKQATKKKTKKR